MSSHETVAGPQDGDDITVSETNRAVLDANALEKGLPDRVQPETITPGLGELQLPPNEKIRLLEELEPEENPKNLPSFQKWLAVLAISTASTCVTCTSSIAAAAETGESRDFHVSKEVTILGISLFVEGLGCGPLLLGPLSEFYGRNPVYWVSYTLFWIFSFPVAFAPNVACFLVFRFISGFSGAAFLSVAGGSVSDLFTNEHVANPMAVYTISPFIGPVLGPLISGFINQNLDWRWTYRVQLIWAFVQLLALILLVPETYEPALLKKKARKLRKNGQTDIFAPLEIQDRGLLSAILVSCYRPFELLFFDRMCMLLDLWSALILGILYLAFQAFPIIFETGHHFNAQMTGLSFLGIGLGMFIGLASQPFWNIIYARETKKHNGHPPPEMRLLMGMPGGLLVPIGLFWLAFTTYPSVPWIIPIIASVPFGSGIVLCFIATFTYLVTAYRPVAASAMASNSALRSAFAAAFPLFASQMYDRLTTPGATALLAGLTLIMAPLPFVFYRYGCQIRKNSKYCIA